MAKQANSVLLVFYSLPDLYVETLRSVQATYLLAGIARNDKNQLWGLFQGLPDSESATATLLCICTLIISKARFVRSATWLFTVRDRHMTQTGM